MPAHTSNSSSWARRRLKGVVRRLAVSGPVELGERVSIGIGSNVWAPCSLVIESDVYIGRYCTVMVDGRIGRGTMIANNVGIIGRKDHDVSAIGVPVRYAPWVGDSETNRSHLSLTTEIGEDVWVGYGAIILSGVSVGRGSVIAAGAVVKDDVEPHSIVAGNPARQVGMRFSEADIVIHRERLASFWRSRPS
jgi:acetyltransferase-like isoleucine patch superfamily enzyme